MIAGLLLLLQTQLTGVAGVATGSAVRPDTVTVGKHFVATLRIRAPLGARIMFGEAMAAPQTVDTVGELRRRDTTATTYVEATAAYRLAAWDTGRVALGIPNATVAIGQATRTIAFSDLSVYVRSVLPADTALRTPRAARPPIEMRGFAWLPWLLAALAAALIGLGAWLWAWYRRRAAAPVPAETWAEREFARIEAMGLLDKGEAAQHAILMTDVMRTYLARRVPGMRVSATTREIAYALRNTARTIANLPGDRALRLLERTDLLKFARGTIGRDEAHATGTEARAVVHATDKAVQAYVAAQTAQLATAQSSKAPPKRREAA